MMRWIVEWSLKFRLLVLAVAAGVLAVGITQLRSMPADVLPEFNPPIVEVQTEALGLSAAEVEQLITVPLEQDLLNGIAFLDEIESASLPGLSSVVLTFDPGTDILDARQVVSERLTQAVGAAGLPEVAKPPQMLQPLSSTSRVAMISLSSDELTPIETSVLARWLIGPRLMGVDGVANVAIWGLRDQQLQVLADPERLRDHDVSLQEVIRTAGNALEVSPLSFLEASSPGTGGWIDTLNQRLHIFHEQAIRTPEQLKQVPLEDQGATQGGNPVTLGDVTDVVQDHQPLIGDAMCSGGECLLLVVEKFPGANTLQVTRGIDEALEAMRPGLPGMNIDTSIYRPAEYIESSFANLGWALAIGALLLLIVLAIFLWDWRRGLIAVVAIALSGAAAALVLYLTETTVNAMVMAGLVMALAVIVDDALVEVDNVTHRLRRRRDEGQDVTALQAVTEAPLGMRRSMLFATLIAAAVLMPFFVMGGGPGAFLPPLALAYLLAVLASMLVALTVTPTLSFMLLSDAPDECRESPVVRWLHRGYDRISPRRVGRPGPALITVAALFLAGLVTFPFLDTSLRPALKEQDLLVHLEAEPGTSLPRMNEITEQVVQDLVALPGVDSIGAHVGRAIASDQIVNVNSGEIWVGVDPEADYTATEERVEHAVDGYPEVSPDVLTYSEERVSDVLQSTDDAIVVRVYGENAEVLRRIAEEIESVLANIEGISSPGVALPTEESIIEVETDLDRAQAFGVKPGDVRRTAATLLSGITVGHLFDEQKVFDVVLWGAPEIRESVDDVGALLVETPGGGAVRLDRVADVRMTTNPTVIRHESVATYVDVRAGVSGRDVGAVAEDVERAIRQVEFPLEHHAALLGDFADQRAAETRVLTVALAVAIGILLILQAAFSSWGLALLAFLALPMVLVGCGIALLITGGTITLGTVAGFVAVLAIAVRIEIALIGHYQDLERDEGMPFGPDLILQGTRDRLAPVLATVVGTAVLLGPVIVAGEVAGLEIVRPLVVVILGGLITSTVVNLFIVPAVTLWYGMRFGFRSERDIVEEELAPGLSEVGTVQGHGLDNA